MEFRRGGLGGADVVRLGVRGGSSKADSMTLFGKGDGEQHFGRKGVKLDVKGAD